MEAWQHKLALAVEQFPKPQHFVPSYGTAGYRADASLLPSTVFRCGVLMALRALKLQASTGLVITASHNPADDNGVKLVEPSGYMLVQDWEAYGDQLTQCCSTEEVLASVSRIMEVENIPTGASSASVWLAHDTRPSAGTLTGAGAAGVQAMGIKSVLCGLLTTPQLHWMLRAHNCGLPCSEGDYCAALCQGFADVASGFALSSEEVLVDCAFGVGAVKLAAMMDRLAHLGIRLSLGNSSAGVLNEGCGADFVEKQRQLPGGFQDVPEGSRCVSIDGDADRLVYFTRKGGCLLLFDGDRIAILAALLVKDLLQQLPAESATMGVVQTVYANGASTRYLTDVLACNVAVTRTGVKHLHHEAAKFGIGIYFEANGHGTVLFDEKLLAKLAEMKATQAAAAQLLAVAQMVNQAVGDAISGILLVEACLRRRGWGLPNWAALYCDLPSRQLKVRVTDRSLIQTVDADRRAVSPEGLQVEIDAAVALVPSGRAFARPSGTEDVVRVYAEAETQEQADTLARTVAGFVYTLAGGVGDRP